MVSDMVAAEPAPDDETVSGSDVDEVAEQDADDEAVVEQDVEDTLGRAIDEGRRRLSRRLAPLLGTGLVGGIDVGTGVLALLLLEDRTGSVLLAGLGFAIGFVALTMARSELFTEDFLIPVTTVIARQAQVRQLLRLWGGTLAANLAGGWVFMWFVMHGYPDLAETAVRAGAHYVDLGLGLRAFSLAVLGGAVITLMTWMQHGTRSMGVRVIPAVTAGWLLAAAQLNHAIVNSLLMFAGLHSGAATYGYGEWAATAGWAAIGNLLGGVGLVTLLRVLQVPHKMQAARERPARGVRMDDSREPPDTGREDA